MSNNNRQGAKSSNARQGAKSSNARQGAKSSNARQGAKSSNSRNNTDQTRDRWNNISGEMMLFANIIEGHGDPFTVFSTSVGKRLGDSDEYVNIYFDVLFPKDEAPDIDEGGFRITVEDGYLTVKTFGEDGKRPAIYVKKWRYVED